MGTAKKTTFFSRLFLNDRNILALISLNAVIIFFQGFPDTGYEQLFTYLDDLLTVLFLTELLVKARHYGLQEYLRSHWNRFDLTLILLSLPSLLVHIIPDLTDYVNVSFLMVLRVLRVFKFFRFIQFFPQVEHIFRSISEALKASFMVLVGFFVLVFIMAIISTFFFQEAAPNMFGNPLKAYYVIFQVFTVEGWNGVTDALVEEAQFSPVAEFFTKAYFIFMLIMGGVFGLSIVNSIFVDAMVSDHDETEQQFEDVEQELKKMHSKMDRLLALLEAKGVLPEELEDTDEEQKD
ncbi:ion transporter [Saprospira grandis]|uniref:ion transporter n=1 Tax=Saprospira grandis TaxID=1008 RepID=UPI0022DD15EC|nr:ion transporter [Saprospira grandis]WBM73600.1 ion transporter [Saprospira grandis]